MFAMKVLKAASFLAAVFFNLIFLAVPSSFASASGGYKYAYVDESDDPKNKVYFCDSKSLDDALFEIPQTYCLEILGEEDGWLKVKYAEDEGVFRALYGFCQSEGLILSNEEPKVKYLKQTVTVTYRTDEVNMLEGLPPIEFEAAYYGALTAGGRRCSYVYCSGYFGYIEGAIEDYPHNPLPSQSTFSPASGGIQSGSLVPLITAAAVASIAVIVITVLYFSDKNPPKNSL